MYNVSIMSNQTGSDSMATMSNDRKETKPSKFNKHVIKMFAVDRTIIPFITDCLNRDQ